MVEQASLRNLKHRLNKMTVRISRCSAHRLSHSGILFRGREPRNPREMTGTAMRSSRRANSTMPHRTMGRVNMMEATTNKILRTITKLGSNSKTITTKRLRKLSLKGKIRSNLEMICKSYLHQYLPKRRINLSKLHQLRSPLNLSSMMTTEMSMDKRLRMIGDKRIQIRQIRSLTERILETKKIYSRLHPNKITTRTTILLKPKCPLANHK
jgi:hypothetical protein